MHTAYTAELSDDWDLTLDANGNLKMLRDTPAIEQNVANEGRLFKDDAYFRADEGIDWFSDQLGKGVQDAVMRNRLRNAAQRVPGVLSVDGITIKELNQETRVLRAKLEITTEGGSIGRAEI